MNRVQTVGPLEGWQEQVKRGMTAPFVDWVFDIYSRPRGLDYVNFSRKTNKFAQVFGNGSLRIVSFSNQIPEFEQRARKRVVASRDGVGVTMPVTYAR
jgi:hypothetical protein